MPTVKPTPVEEWMNETKKSQEPEAPSGASLRITVVYGGAKDEENAASWIAKDILGHVNDELPGSLQTAEFHLPDMHIARCQNCYGGGGHVCSFPCDRNDIQSPLYDKADEMLKIHERLISTDMLLVAADVRWGGLNHHVQKFVERLNPFPNRAADKHPLLKSKVAGVVVVGDSSLTVAGQLMAALNASGFAFPCYGYVAWSVPRLVSKDSVKTAYQKSQAIQNDSMLVAADLVRFAKLLRGL